MDKTLKRALVSLAVAFVVYVVGMNVIWSCDDNILYLASVIAGGCCWIGSKE
jgi:hypothetical protein